MLISLADGSGRTAKEGLLFGPNAAQVVIGKDRLADGVGIDHLARRQHPPKAIVAKRLGKEGRAVGVGQVIGINRIANFLFYRF